MFYKNSNLTKSQYCYFFRDLFFSTKKNPLFKKGLLIKKNYFENSFLNTFSKYFEHDNLDFVTKRIKLSKSDAIQVLNKLSPTIKSEIKNYLGTNLYCTEYDAVTAGNQTAFDGSYQAHHDQRGRRIKIFVYVKDSAEDSHPLFYLIGSHQKFKKWTSYKDTRFTNIERDQMFKFIGKKGDVAFFDTHGLHSHNKLDSGLRCIIKLVIENFSYYNNLYFKSSKAQLYLKQNEAIRIDFI